MGRQTHRWGIGLLLVVVVTQGAVVYAALFAEILPGPAVVRGLLISLAPWLLAQMAFMPMMGAGLCSGSMLAAGGSLVGHLAYGAVGGTLYGRSGARVEAPGRTAHA